MVCFNFVNSLLVFGCWLLVVGFWLLVGGWWLVVVGCWLGFREVLDTFCLSLFHFERQNTRTDVVVWN